MTGSTEKGNEPARTLGRLHLQAERANARRPVVTSRIGAEWQPTPAWRFYRQVIRLALFLRDRMRVGPGDRVLVVSRLRGERVVAEWAAVTVGAVAVHLDIDSIDGSLAAILAEIAPKGAFVSAPEQAGRLPGLVAEAVVSFDGASPAARAWAEALDLGGTLDTAERAQTFRSQAGALTPDMPAIGFAGTARGASATFLTHGQLADRIRAFWAEVPTRDGDVAYVAGDSGAEPCVPVWAFVADGRTSTVFGTPGRELDEIAELRPQLVVAPPGLAGRLGRPERPAARTTLSRLLGRVPVVGAVVDRVLPVGDDTASRDALRDIVTFDGTRSGDHTRRIQ